MTPDTVLEWAKAISILGAIIFGGFAVFSPSWVWLRIQAFKWGSGLLLGFGTVLLVSPIFRNVQFTIDTKGLDLRLNALSSQISQVRASVTTLAEGFDKLTPVNLADMKELDRKVQSVQAALTAIESELPKVAAIGERVKQFERTAAAIDKSAKLLNERILLVNYADMQQSTDANAWDSWVAQNYPGLDFYQPNKIANFKKRLEAMRYDKPFPFAINNPIVNAPDKTTGEMK